MEEKAMEEKPSRTGVQYLTHNKEKGRWIMSP